jgi:hypothetical protein
MAWSALVVKFWSHSSDATSLPMSFMEELELKVNLEDPFFTKKVCSKTLSLNITIKIDENQTFGRQFNTTQFIEASMEHEDFGKELTVKVLFRGEQRWRRFMQSHSLRVSKPYSTQYPIMVDFCIHLERVDDNHSTVILKVVLCNYKDSLEK